MRGAIPSLLPYAFIGFVEESVGGSKEINSIR
jgi:hypothetical protein